MESGKSSAKMRVANASQDGEQAAGYGWLHRYCCFIHGPVPVSEMLILGLVKTQERPALVYPCVNLWAHTDLFRPPPDKAFPGQLTGSIEG